MMPRRKSQSSYALIELKSAQVCLCLHYPGQARHRSETLLDRAACRPFLKWPGGKQWLAPFIAEIADEMLEGMYYEPFLGGGSSFFATETTASRLGDTNAILITTFCAIRDHVDDVIKELYSYSNDLQCYRKLRDSRPRSPVRVAARLIYLNKTAFNGMYRENRKGHFNVPFGHYENPSICNESRLRATSLALRRVHFVAGDFQITLVDAERGDFVYLDPPYITGHTHNDFIKYNARLFSWEDQKRLADTARTLARLGVNVIISQADFDPVISMYRGFFSYRIKRNSLIGGGNLYRGTVCEALLTSFPIFGVDAPQV